MTPNPDEREAHEMGRLLIAVGDRDRQAFEHLYTRSAAKLFGICLRICVERQMAEDVLQDVYLTIWRRAGSYDPARGGAAAWMATIARNRAIDHRRAKQHRPVAGTDHVVERVDPAPLASDKLERSEEAARLHRCLDRLSEPQRDAIRTAFFDGLSYPEIAAQRAQPLGTVKSWIRRGLQTLRLCLDDA